MASKGINKVIIVGNLGKDPEMSAMPNGTVVAHLSVATTESWTDKATNERKELTEWHRVVLKGRLAEIAQAYLRKGSKVYLEGSNRTRSWTDKQTGVDRWMTEVHCRELQMLDSRRDVMGDMSHTRPRENTVQQTVSQTTTVVPQTEVYEQFDDDIPF